MLILKRTVVNCCFCFRKFCTFVSVKLHHTFYLFFGNLFLLPLFVMALVELFVMTRYESCVQV